MPRGGKRHGAGRPPPDIDPETAMLIRRDCEHRANVQRKQQASQRHDRKLAKRGVFWGEDGEPNPVHQVPLSYRAVVAQYGHHDTKARYPSDLPEEVKYAIDTMRTNRKANGAYSYPLPRLYGGRQAIIDAVAADWSATGVRVSPRTVRTIWETLEAPSDDV